MAGILSGSIERDDISKEDARKVLGMHGPKKRYVNKPKKKGLMKEWPLYPMMPRQ